jgi:hypothetical protein
MNYIKKIREFLKDPKKKALTQLGLYGVFFIFVFILINSSSNSVNTPIINEPKTPVEYYEDMTSYDYKVTYTNIDKIDVIEGTYYNNTSLFTYNNLKYYYEDMLYVINNDSYILSNIEYDVSKIFNNNLHTIFDNLNEESKTTYKDGKVVTNYTLDSNIIHNYLYNIESTYTNLISVSITENNDIITNITFDLTNLGLYLNKIEVEYNNINNIESLDVHTIEGNL